MNKDKSHKDVNKDESHKDVNKDKSHKDVNKDKSHKDVNKEKSHKDVNKERSHKDVNKERAVRFITKNYSRRDSVSPLRSDLGLPTLQQRRLTSKLTMLYKIHHQEVAVEIPNHYVPTSTPSIKTRRKHTEQYKIISTRSDTYKHSFYPSVIPV